MAKIKLDNPDDVKRLIQAFRNNVKWLSDNLSKQKEENDYHIQVANTLRTLFVDHDIPLFFLIEKFLGIKNEIYVIDFEAKISKAMATYGVKDRTKFKTFMFSPYVCSVDKPLYEDVKKVTIEDFLQTDIANPAHDVFIKALEVIKGFPNGDGGTHFGSEKPPIKALREGITVGGGIPTFNNDENFWGKNIIYRIGEVILQLCENMDLQIKLKMGEVSFKQNSHTPIISFKSIGESK